MNLNWSKLIRLKFFRNYFLKIYSLLPEQLRGQPYVCDVRPGRYGGRGWVYHHLENTVGMAHSDQTTNDTLKNTTWTIVRIIKSDLIPWTLCMRVFHLCFCQQTQTSPQCPPRKLPPASSSWFEQNLSKTVSDSLDYKLIDVASRESFTFSMKCLSSLYFLAR